MAAMNWPTLLETLRKRGWTQALLSERLGIAQSAVSDLRRGETADPKHSTGEAIRKLHESGECPVSGDEVAPDPQADQAVTQEVEAGHAG